jgi:hypothetical protein
MSKAAKIEQNNQEECYIAFMASSREQVYRDQMLVHKKTLPTSKTIACIEGNFSKTFLEPLK